MTSARRRPRSGLPPSESAELAGLGYQVDQARERLRSSLDELAAQAGSSRPGALARLEAKAAAGRVRAKAATAVARWWRRRLTTPGRVAAVAGSLGVITVVAWLATRGRRRASGGGRRAIPT